MKIPYALRNPSDQLLLVGVGSVLSGFAAGYFWAKHKYAETIAVAADIIEDIAVEDNQLVLPMESKKPKFVPVDLNSLVVTDETVNVTTAADIQASRDAHPTNYNRIDEIEKTEITVTDEVTDEPIVTLVRNAFGNIEDVWDYELEANNRTPEAPYVIHYEEYMADEMDYRQITVTYYEGDDVMADEADRPIYNYSALMGDLKFGHGSNDPSVVYIRNEKLHQEWEILRHTSSFSMEVLGQHFDEQDARELRHSVSKFRPE